jgi:hypothetical protein
MQREKVGSYDELIYQILQLKSESLQFCRTRHEKDDTSDVNQWRRPNGDILKINTDGAY